MKRLILMLGAVALATLSQAATANWKWQTATTSGGPIYAYGGAATLASATAYIFADGLQSDVYDQWKTDKTMMSGSLDNSSVSSGAISLNESAFGTEKIGSNQNFFFAIIDANNNLYISATKGGSESELKDGTTLKFSAKASSSATPFTTATTSYAGAGWYTAAAVPEPTSGLLLLLGVAGLALRRRRA